MDIYSKKALESFKGKVVRKDLTSLMKRIANVPSYVVEYLLGMYCASDDQKVIDLGIKKISNILATNYIKNDEIEKTKFILTQKGEYVIIDKINAVVNEVTGEYLCTLQNFKVVDNIKYKGIKLDKEYAEKFPKVFTGGIWAMIKLKYDHFKDVNPEDEDDEDNKKKEKVIKSNLSRKKRSNSDLFSSPYSIETLKPIQIPMVNIDFILDNRKNFTLEEWIIFILRSCGIEALNLNQKERFHFLERIVPLFERNYNLVELGPRGTGKSHIYKEISPYSVLVSGSKVSVANLFYNTHRRIPGLVCNWDCVSFDEIAGLTFNDQSGIQICKDYMASGSFTRGKDMIFADASMVFLGNINDTVENLLKISHLFSPFPNDFKNDSAFFDRIHYYLPGWEIPKIKSQSLTEEFGLISDCFAEFAKEMRKHDYTHVFDEWFKFNKNVNIRDEVAIRKTVSGMIKILYPDLKFTKEDIEELLVYAIEGRRRVKEQLRVISGDEFADLDLGYIRNDGKEVIVNVPEKTNSTLIPKKTLIPGHVSFVGYSLDNKLPGVYRMETKVVDGTGKIEVQGVVGRHRSAAKEAFNAGWKYFLEFANNVTNMPNIFMNDYHIYLNDLQSRSSTSELSVAQFISLCSGILEKSVIDRLAVIGEVTLSGTIQDIKGLEDYVRAAANAGAEIILMPHTCKNAFESITDSKIKNVNPVYYRNPIEACKIALNISEE